jgi:hypothetical protein
MSGADECAGAGTANRSTPHYFEGFGCGHGGFVGAGAGAGFEPSAGFDPGLAMITTSS